MNKKQIEDYINTYRLYPKNYRGKRDRKILHDLTYSHRYNAKDNTITKLIGYINDDGDFVLGSWYTYSLDNPEDKTPATYLDRHFKYKVTMYNKMMIELGYPDSVINDEQNSEWNLRDMFAEVDRILLHYLENGSKFDLKSTDLTRYRNEKYRLERFIRANKDKIEDMIVTTKHNSKYDNMEE